MTDTIISKLTALMKFDWPTRLSLLLYKYVTGPITDGIVFLFQSFFVWLDKLTGNEIRETSNDKELEKYRKQMNLQPANVPVEIRSLLPLAVTWGIGDDAIRSDVVEAATDADKHSLASALDGKLGAIDRWITSFPEVSMSREAEAFMYLCEAVEELGLDVDYE